jgi:hypothetical protein
MKRIKRIVVAVVGGTVLALGIALIVLPGPAFLVIPAGLAILAIEFAWAKRWLRKAREWLPGAGCATQKLIWQTRRTPRAGSRASARFNARIANYQSFDS